MPAGVGRDASELRNTVGTTAGAGAADRSEDLVRVEDVEVDDVSSFVVVVYPAAYFRVVSLGVGGACGWW